MHARDDNHWKHGTTLHFMAPEVDAVGVVARRFAEISEDDTARTLYDKVCSESISLFEDNCRTSSTGPSTNVERRRRSSTASGTSTRKRA